MKHQYNAAITSYCHIHSISNNKITLNGLENLLEFLKLKKIEMTGINLSANELNDECMTVLGNFISDNDIITQLWISENTFTDNGIETLSQNIKGKSTLQILYMTQIEGVTDVSIPHLIKIVESTSITEIVLNQTSISGPEKLSVALALNSIYQNATKLEIIG